MSFLHHSCSLLYIPCVLPLPVQCDGRQCCALLMSYPLGMKAHCSDKRLIQSLHHIHIPHTLLPLPPVLNPKSTQFSIYQIICTPLNKSSSLRFTMANFFPEDFIKRNILLFLRRMLYSAPCTRLHISVMQRTYFSPLWNIFLNTRKGNMYLAWRTSKRLAASPVHTAFLHLFYLRRQRQTQQTCSCQLRGYNY